MKKYKIGILRVRTTEDSEILNSHQKILMKYFPEFEIETRCIPNQYKGLYNQEAHDKALPDIISMAKDWEKDLDGLIISCADDPGVDILKKELSIPVVGAGASAACLSVLHGLKTGVLGIEEDTPQSMKKVFGDRVVFYVKPEGVLSTNDLETEEGKNAILKSAYKLKKFGAEIITFACTGLSTMGAAKLINEVGLPVVDGVIAEGIAMKGLLLSYYNKD